MTYSCIKEVNFPSSVGIVPVNWLLWSCLFIKRKIHLWWWKI